MNGRLPHIVIDPGGLDVAIPRGGQFRYVVDLVRELDALRPMARFTLLGGSPDPVRELAPVFSHAGWEYLPFPRPVGRGAMYREQVQLAKALWRVRADLYHGLHTVIPVLAPCPVITTLYDLMYEIFPEYSAAVRSRPYRLYRWSVRHRVRRSICISQTTASDAHRLWHLPERKLDVIHLGTTILPSDSAVPPVPGVPVEGPVILSMYNLESRKNLAALLVAVAAVRKIIPGVRLVLIGGAGLSPEREQLFVDDVRRLDLMDAVTRTGRVCDQQLTWLYRRADVFAFPSLYEGFGYPVLEAMAAGGCVVARRASAMAEVVGTAGVLVETADPGETAAAIQWLLRTPTERDRLRTQAAVRAREFTVRRMSELTWRSYEVALQKARPVQSHE